MILTLWEYINDKGIKVMGVTYPNDLYSGKFIKLFREIKEGGYRKEPDLKYGKQLRFIKFIGNTKDLEIKV
jgi:hypothetical protein